MSPAKSTSVENVVNPSAIQLLIRRMEMTAEYEEANVQFRGDDINSILEAETEEEMWEADSRGPLNGKDLEDCELIIHNIVVKFSRKGVEDMQSVFTTEDGRQLYLLVESTRISEAGNKTRIRLPVVGEQFTWNTSARFIVAKLDWLSRHDLIPGAEVVVKAIDLGGGQSVLKLAKVSQRIVRG